MNWKNLKLGVKLGTGFGLVIALAITLGLLAVYNMSNIDTETGYLINDYFPEVEVATNLERETRDIMYNMRGYALSQNPEYYELVLEDLTHQKNRLDKAELLATLSTQLGTFKEKLVTARDNINKYEKAAKTTNKIIKSIDLERSKLDAAAAVFIESVNVIDDSQDRQFKEEIRTNAGKEQLAERIIKINYIQEVYNLGSNARINANKSLINNDVALLNMASKSN